MAPRFSLLLAVSVFLSACATNQPIEVIEIRDAPVVLKIKTTVLRTLESYPEGRIQVEATIIEPTDYTQKAFSIVVDNVPYGSEFRKISETWIVDFDDFSFVSIDSAGISFWDYEDLNPRKF